MPGCHALDAPEVSPTVEWRQKRKLLRHCVGIEVPWDPRQRMQARWHARESEEVRTLVEVERTVTERIFGHRAVESESASVGTVLGQIGVGPVALLRTNHAGALVACRFAAE